MGRSRGEGDKGKTTKLRDVRGVVCIHNTVQAA